MDSDQKTQFVIRELRRYRKVDDITFALAHATGEPWDQTAAFVNQVAADSKDEIEDSRQPLIAAIGIALVVAGLGGMIGVAVATFSGWIVFILQIPIPYLGNALLFGFCLMLAVGGLVGLAQMIFKPEPGAK